MSFPPATSPEAFGENSIGKSLDRYSAVLKIFELGPETKPEIAGAHVDKLQRAYLQNRMGHIEKGRLDGLRRTVARGGNLAVNEIFDQIKQVVAEAIAAAKAENKKPVAASDRERNIMNRPVKISMRDLALTVARQRGITFGEASVIVDDAVRAGTQRNLTARSGPTFREIVQHVAQSKGITFGQAMLIVEDARARNTPPTPSWPGAA